MGTEKKKGLSLVQALPSTAGDGRRSKPAVVSVKREVGARVANIRLAGPQAYFIRLGLSWVCAQAAVDK
jgi:hypothetical protein